MLVNTGSQSKSSPVSFNRLLRISFLTAVFTVLFGLLLVYQHEPTREWVSAGVNYIGYNFEEEERTTLADKETILHPSEVESTTTPHRDNDIIVEPMSYPQSTEEVETPPPTPAPPRPPAVAFVPRSNKPSNRTILLSNRFRKVHSSFWDAIKKTVGCPSKYLKLTGGENKWDDGGKWTCGLKEIGNTAIACDTTKPCALISFGVKGNSYFEAEVMNKTCCNVFAYDPADTKIGKPISDLNPRVQFHQMAVGDKDTNNTKKFKTIMEEHGYEWVDIVKMDIEGSEYSVLDSILEDFEVFPMGMLLVEFHSDQPRKILDTFDKLESKGMRMFHAEINPYFPDYACEYSFINVNAEYDFLVELINMELLA